MDLDDAGLDGAAGEAAEATTPVEQLIQHASSLARHLGTYQRALTYITHAEPQEMEQRIRAIILLSEPLDMGVDELLNSSGISRQELRSLQEHALVSVDGRRVMLSTFGESFLGLLFSFNKQLDGASSDGYIDLLRGVSAAGDDVAFYARLLVGSSFRLAHNLESATRTGSPAELAQHKGLRERASQRVDAAMDVIGRHVSDDIQADLRRGSTRLLSASIQQQRVHTRINKENILLPQGKSFNDAIQAMTKATFHDFLDVMHAPGLFRSRPYVPAKPPLEAGLRHLFKQRTETETPPEFTLQTTIEGAPPLPKAIAELLSDLAEASDGSFLHDNVSGPRSFFAGLWFARTKVHSALRHIGISFSVDETARIHQPPYLDIPTITILRSSND